MMSKWMLFTVFLIITGCYFSTAFAEVVAAELEDKSVAQLNQILTILNKNADATKKEIRRLKAKWEEEPSNILAERIRRERIIEDMQDKVENMIVDIQTVEDEIALREQEEQDRIEQEKRAAEQQAQREAEFKAREERRKNTKEDTLVEGWDPDTKEKFEALQAAEELRKTQLEEEQKQEAAAKTRNNIITIAVILIIAIGAVVFIRKKMSP